MKQLEVNTKFGSTFILLVFCYLNGTQPQITMLAEAVMLLRLLNQDE